MKLLIVMVTYNRLEYTRKTLDSLQSTIKVPHELIVVDNYSMDGTQDWLRREILRSSLILNPENYYPGKACNIGWEYGLKKYSEATHLMRLDNDMEFKEGWDTKAEEYFNTFPDLGQLGIEHNAIMDPNNNGQYRLNYGGLTLDAWPGVVGGPNIVAREVWDKGARYDETPWSSPEGVPAMQEDSKFSFTIRNLGYMIGHMTERLAWTFADESNWKDYPDYYMETMKTRGYTEHVAYLESLKEKKDA